jgi:hypothetical protein
LETKILRALKLYHLIQHDGDVPPTPEPSARPKPPDFITADNYYAATPATAQATPERVRQSQYSSMSQPLLFDSPAPPDKTAVYQSSVSESISGSALTDDSVDMAEQRRKRAKVDESTFVMTGQPVLNELQDDKIRPTPKSPVASVAAPPAPAQPAAVIDDWDAWD